MDSLLPVILAALLAQTAKLPERPMDAIPKPVAVDAGARGANAPVREGADPGRACIAGYGPGPVSVEFVSGTEAKAPRPDVALRALAEFARAHGCRILVEGYSDAGGTQQRKQDISRRRAGYVRDVLALAWPEGRIEASGRGEMREAGVPAAGKRVARASLAAP